MAKTILRGTRDYDEIIGTAADERLVGRAGEDWLYGAGGADDLLGGHGNDYLELGLSGTGRALGGVGNDFLVGTSGHTLAGGSGDDIVNGTGRLFGDERPGLAQRTIGNDYLNTHMGSLEGVATHTTHTGGRGVDTFNIQAYFNGFASSVVVTDFLPGQDKVRMGLSYADGQQLDTDTVWAVLDTNGDGTLGNDTPWDGNSAVTVGEAGLTIRLHEDIVTIAGITSLSAADWAF